LKLQKNEFIRLGILGDWDKPYITMDYEYEAVILSELYKFSIMAVFTKALNRYTGALIVLLH